MRLIPLKIATKTLDPDPLTVPPELTLKPQRLQELKTRVAGTYWMPKAMAAISAKRRPRALSLAMALARRGSRSFTLEGFGVCCSRLYGCMVVQFFALLQYSMLQL